MSPATRVAQISALRGVSDRLITVGQATTNPARRLPSPRVPPPNVDIQAVQRLLRHASKSATVGYTHLAVDDLVPEVTRVFGGAMGEA